MKRRNKKISPTAKIESAYPQMKLTPKEFELQVKEWIDVAGKPLDDYNSIHRETLSAEEGEYEIDITARFTALGANYLTLIECKYYTHRVKREHVQALRDKIQSLGAQKGIMFATRGYQSGAIRYAKAHGIGIVLVADGRSCWLVRDDAVAANTAWEHVPDYIPRMVGWVIKGKKGISLVSSEHSQHVAALLGL